MTLRLALATALLLIPLGITSAAPTYAEDPAPDTAPTAVNAPAVPHRFFFANAQRESLTGRANARGRMGRMVAKLRASGADLGVLVELEGHQPHYFSEATDKTWGLIAGAHGVRDSVIYRRDVWTPVSQQTMSTYRNNSTQQRTPVVILVDRAGTRVGVIPVHNPRDSTRLRAINNRRILRTVKDLQRQQIPVVVAGDFNSGRPAMCRYTRHTPGMASASHRRAHPCRHARAARIDQAFATPDLRLTHYRAMPSRATDHGYVYAITLRPRPVSQGKLSPETP